MHAVVNESLAPTLNCLLRIKREAEPKKQWHRCKARLSIDAAMASLAGSRQDMRDECRADSPTHVPRIDVQHVEDAVIGMVTEADGLPAIEMRVDRRRHRHDRVSQSATTRPILEVQSFWGPSGSLGRGVVRRSTFVDRGMEDL